MDRQRPATLGASLRLAGALDFARLPSPASTEATSRSGVFLRPNRVGSEVVRGSVGIRSESAADLLDRLSPPRSGRRKAYLAAIGTLTGAFMACGVGSCGNDHAHPKPTDSANAALLRAANIADRLSAAGGYPFSTSLANQLHLSDPARPYEALSSPTQVASGASIGVYATASTLWLTRRVQGGLVMQLRRVNRGQARGTYGPTAITPSGLANGDFSTPLNETWRIEGGPVARVARYPQVSRASPASLRVKGTGRRGRSPTLVYQTIEPLPLRAAGTAYTVDLVARTADLSRPLAVEAKLDYRDGSYEFFVAMRRNAQSAGAAIPKGTSSKWVALEIRAVARKRVRRLTVYAVDTGLIPLRGTAWIDDVTLVVTKR